MAKQYDESLTELGWYVRNCALSPFARRLEPILGETVCAFRETQDEADFDFIVSAGRKTLNAEVKRIAKIFARPPRVKTHGVAAFAREVFGLDATETEIFLLLQRYERSDVLENFVDGVTRALKNTPKAIAVLIAHSVRDVDARLRPAARLVESGVVIVDEDSTGLGPGCFARLGRKFLKTLSRSWDSRAEWLTALLGPSLTTDLGWDDYAHLSEMRELARRSLAGTAARNACGVNVLLHGPVGTGKTEFAKVLAAAAGLRIFAVAESNDEGDEPSRGERLASLRLLQRLLKGQRDALILLDIAEDVLEQTRWSFAAGPRTGSKVHLNRLLETNAKPVLWTCNDIHSMDPAVLRRMTLAIEVKTPGRAARARIWRQSLAAAEVTLGDGVAERLAARYDAPAGIAANAARAASLAEGGENEVERALDGLLALIGKRRHHAAQSALAFDPHFVNCETNIAALSERLARPGAPLGWSMCLSGPPGSGKSEYARHLADRLGLEVLHRRASDLLGMFVGESEQNIACAFAEARDGRAMLVFDEADSLLADRRSAVCSWEITQVNEMLTWMEQHPLPFVCTTNLAERLDEASFRRFTFKLRFLPLDAARAAAMFAHAFGCGAPSTLPDGLAPGDFATVRRKRDLFGAAQPSQLVRWLEEEAEAKGARATRIGFAFLPRKAGEVSGERSENDGGGK